MPVAQLKNYYKILELDHTATADEVKKAYRRMAMKYHPDKSGQDAFAESFFREVQEAYDILGDAGTRAKYDEELWLAGMTERARSHEQVSPMWILKEAIKLNNHMATVDVYRMNHRALHDYIFQLLNDHHMATLQQAGETSVNEQVVKMLVQATRALRYSYMQPVAGRLILLAGDDVASIRMVHHALAGRRRQAAWEQAMPFVIAGITLLLVAAMYWWAGR